MPPELVRARAWGTRLAPTTSPTSARETEKERIYLSFTVCQSSHDDEKYAVGEGACQGGRPQDCRRLACPSCPCRQSAAAQAAAKGPRMAQDARSGVG